MGGGPRFVCRRGSVRPGGFVRGNGRFPVSWCKEFFFLGGGRLRRGKRGMLIGFLVRLFGDEGFCPSLFFWFAVSREKRFGNQKGRKRQEEQSKTRTTKKMKMKNGKFVLQTSLPQGLKQKTVPTTL